MIGDADDALGNSICLRMIPPGVCVQLPRYDGWIIGSWFLFRKRCDNAGSGVSRVYWTGLGAPAEALLFLFIGKPVVCTTG